MLSVRRGRAKCRDLEPVWNRLALAQSDLPLGNGPMCHSEFAWLVREIFAPEADVEVVEHRSDDGAAAVMPWAVKAGRFGSSGTYIPSIYPGRAGIVHDARVGEDELRELFEYACSTWSHFSLAIIADSPTESALKHAVKVMRAECQTAAETQVPFIVFPETWDEYIMSLPKKFRYTIRSGEKVLREAGELEVRSYETEESCDEFLAHIRKIESMSWKHQAGTSLTKQQKQWQFHERLAPIAARLSLLQGYVLLVDGTPVAHILGIRFGDTFCDLKESFDENYSQQSPGAVLKSLAIKDLLNKGVSGWDFVGQAEFHKLRWTSTTYTVRQYEIFCGWKGRLSLLRNRLAATLRAIKLLRQEERPQFGRPESL